MARIAVVGGGISGLAAGFRLQTSAAGHSLLLFEKERRFGGKIKSRFEQGFLFEEGPDSFLTRKPAAVELCRELGIDEQLIGRARQERGSAIYHNGRLHPLPEGFSGLVPSDAKSLKESGLLSEDGLRRMQEEAPSSVPSDDGEESVADYLIRKYGLEAFEVMVEPLVSGIFAGDARSLSLQSAFPQLAGQKGLRASAPPVGGPTAARDRNDALPPFVSFPRGMGQLTEALQSCIRPECLQPEEEVVTVSRRSETYLIRFAGGSTVEVDAVILALPPNVVSRLAGGLSSVLAEAHAEIESASTVVVNLGYRSDQLPEPFQGYGYLSPMIDRRPFHGCTWSSNKWVGRAPDGFAGIRLYGGRYGESALFEATDEDILSEASQELAETMGLRTAPIASRVSRWAEGIPQYNLGYASILKKIQEALEGLPGLFLAGAAYGGVGIPDCIRSGAQAALQASDYLARHNLETK